MLDRESTSQNMISMLGVKWRGRGKQIEVGTLRKDLSASFSSPDTEIG